MMRWLAAALTVTAILIGGTTPVAAETTPAEVSIYGAAAVEGATEELTVEVFNIGTKTVTVDFTTVNGTAIASADYRSTKGRVTFAPGGPTTATINVPTLQDARDEPSETIFVRLSRLVNATFRSASALAYVVDDDYGPSRLTSWSARQPDDFQPMPVWCGGGSDYSGCYEREDFHATQGVKTTVINAHLADNFEVPIHGRSLEFWVADPATNKLQLWCRIATSGGDASCYVSTAVEYPTGRYEVRFLGDAEHAPSSAAGQLQQQPTRRSLDAQASNARAVRRPP